MILDYAKKCERSMLFSTILMLVLGMVLAFEPEKSIKVITGIVAAFFGIVGFIQLVIYIKQDRLERIRSYSLILGVVLIGICVFLFVNLESLANFITILIGISILVKSLFKLQFAINIKDLSDKWLYNLIVGLIGSVLGIVLLFNPWDSATVFLKVIGIILAIGSVIEFIETMIVMKTLDDTEDAVEDAIKESKKGKKIIEVEEVEEETKEDTDKEEHTKKK